MADISMEQSRWLFRGTIFNILFKYKKNQFTAHSPHLTASKFLWLWFWLYFVVVIKSFTPIKTLKMKTIKNFLLVLVGIAFASCQKDNDVKPNTDVDLASRAVGTYQGNLINDVNGVIVHDVFEFTVSKVDNETIQISGDNMPTATIKVTQHPTIPTRLDSPNNFTVEEDGEYVFYYLGDEQFVFCTTVDEAIFFNGHRIN